MATLEERQEHLKIAHEAGNTALAQRIADTIRSEQAAPTKLTDFPMVQRGIGILEGAQDLIQDPAVNMMTLFGSEEEKAQGQEYRQAREERIEDVTGDVSQGWRLGGSLIGGLGGVLRSAPTWTARMAQNAGMGGVFGMTAPAENLGEAAGNVGLGLLAGAVLPSILEAGVKLPVGFVKYMKNAFKPGDFNAEQAVKFAVEKALPLMPDDVSRNRLLKTIGQYVDQIDPTSTRQDQIDAARAYLSEMADRFKITDDVGAVVSRPEDLIGPSLKAETANLKGQSRANYKQAGELLQGEFPGGALPDAEIRKTVNSVLAELGALPPEQRMDIEPLMNSYLKMLDEPADFATWDTRRSALLDDIRDAAGVSGNKKKHRLLSQVQTSIFDTMNKYADDVGGDAKAAWERARKFHREQIVPRREGTVGKAVTKNDPETFVKELLSSGVNREGEARANQLFRSLDPKGREASRQMIMEEIYKFATAKAEDIGMSPAKAANRLNQFTNRIKRFYGPDVAAEAEGLANYLRYINRASLGAGTSGTGATLIPAVAGGALIGSVVGGATDDEPGVPWGSIGTGATAALLITGLRTPRGRAMLQKLSQAEEGSGAFKQIVEDIEQYVAKQAGIQADEVTQ